MTEKKYFEQDMNNILKGLEEAYRRMIIYKRQKNSPVILFRDGAIRSIDPFEMESTTTYIRKMEDENP